MVPVLKKFSGVRTQWIITEMYSSLQLFTQYSDGVTHKDLGFKFANWFRVEMSSYGVHSCKASSVNILQGKYQALLLSR